MDTGRVYRIPKKRELPGAMDRWLEEFSPQGLPGKGRVGVLCFRSRSWIRWAVFASFQLARLGYRPVLISWSGDLALRDQDFWTRARAVPSFDFLDIEPERLSDVAVTLPYRELARRLAPLAVAQELRIESAETTAHPVHGRRVEQLASALPVLAAACEQALRQASLQRVVCPSGIIGWSGAFLAAARAVGIPCICVEFWKIRSGHMIWNLDRPAIDYDTAGWDCASGPWTAEKERKFAELVRLREGAARPSGQWLGGFHNAQRAPAGETLAPALEAFLRRTGPILPARPQRRRRQRHAGTGDHLRQPAGLAGGGRGLLPQPSPAQSRRPRASGRDHAEATARSGGRPGP